MSHLKAARLEMEAAWKELLRPVDSRTLRAMDDLIAHLEAQEQSQQEHQHLLSVAGVQYLTEEPYETPSSPDITQEEATPPTSVILWTSWCPVNPDGTLEPSVLAGILASLSSHLIVGPKAVEVILSIPTPRATTSPAGSASPSTGEPRHEANGHAGVQAHD